MKTNHGNLDARFVYQGSLAGTSEVVPGDGLTPGAPLAEHGGLRTFRIDVDVPATVAGSLADFSVTYASSYASPANAFHLLRYANPIDTAKKLHGKGNLWIKKAVVMQGSALTGAVQPTMVGGTVDIAIRTSGTLTNIWQYSAAIATGTQIITPASELAKGVVIGTDVGEDYMTLVVQPVTQNLIAGRYRILLLGCEV